MNRISLNRIFKVTLWLALASTLLGGCSAQDFQQRLALSNEEPILLLIQTPVTTLDPAGAKNAEDFRVLSQIYPSALRYSEEDSSKIQGLGETARFVSETEFEFEIPNGVRFANGNPLSASDVAFSLNRFKKLSTSGYFSDLLRSLVAAKSLGDSTVSITLDSPLDISFPHALTSLAGLVVDEETFSATEVLGNSEVVLAQPFAGNFVVKEVFENDKKLVLAPNPTQHDMNSQSLNSGVTLQFAHDIAELREHLNSGKIDAFLAADSQDIKVLGASSMVFTGKVSSSVNSVEGVQVLCEAYQNKIASGALASENQFRGVGIALYSLASKTLPAKRGSVSNWGSLFPSNLPGSEDDLVNNFVDDTSELRGFEPDSTNLAKLFEKLDQKIPLSTVIGDRESQGNLPESVVDEILKVAEEEGVIERSNRKEKDTVQVSYIKIVPRFLDASSVLGSVLSGSAINGGSRSELNWLFDYFKQAQELNPSRRPRALAASQSKVRNDNCLVPLVEVSPTLYLAEGLTYSESEVLDFMNYSFSRIERVKID